MQEHQKSHSHPAVREHHTPHPPPAEQPVSTAAAQAPAHPGAFGLLLPALQRAVTEEGYTTPTPIQEQTIPHLLAGRDLLGCAQTGTGKTAAFTLPILQYLDQRRKPLLRGQPRVLILAPTRELAAQIGDSIATYGRHLRCSHTVIFGGVGQNPQVQALNRGVDILVATPGRLLDLMNQRFVRLDGVEVFVLDEADRMLDMGFINDIRKIIPRLPRQRQSLFFSATLATEVVALARTLVHDPVHITIAPEQPTVERIAQTVLFMEKASKVNALIALLGNQAIDKVLVFTRMKHGANRLADRLLKAGISTQAIHGNKSQSARMKALDDFKRGQVRVLVATDIAARGLDVDGITHVVNFDLPVEPEVYVHRIGRTARAGAEGDAVSFCCPEEREALRAIERLIRREIPVDSSHRFHSEAAREATGAGHRPHKGGRPLPGRRQGGHSFAPRRAHGPAGRRHPGSRRHAPR